MKGKNPRRRRLLAKSGGLAILSKTLEVFYIFAISPLLFFIGILGGFKIGIGAGGAGEAG